MTGAAENSARLVCLAAIAGAVGVKGEVRIKPFTQEPEDIGRYGTLVLGEEGREIEIASIRPGKGSVVARIKGVEDRAGAEALKGEKLYVMRDVLPEPEADEFYFDDLVGLAAEDPSGEKLGRVAAVYNFGAQDVLEIAPGGDANSFMVPFLKEVVTEVDIKGGKIVVQLPQGMNEERAEKDAGK